MSAESYGLGQSLIPSQSIQSSFGELFMSTPESKGTLQMIEQFKGKKINGISGGHKKIFLFEEVDESQNVVTALHPQSEDFLQYKQERNLPIDQIITSIQGLRIISIISGKTHNIIKTEQGKIFSFGKGEFGSLGLGGCAFTAKPRLINKLSNKKIISIACGAYHSLALSQIGDLFSWGRGFQGQLGLLQTTETVSCPQFIPHFFKYDSHKDAKKLKKVPIHKIACGSYHSLAIDCQGNLYSWGEALYGQTGTGRKNKEPKPVKLQIEIDGKNRKVQKVAGGYGHTLCLTNEGQIFGWGLNIKGQVGINDLREGMKSSQNKIDYCKAVLHPRYLKQSRESEPLPKFIDIACGFSRSFAIDINGSIWGWGGGCLGFKERYSERGPTKLTEGTQNKKFSKVYANEDSLLAFAKVSPTYFKPTLAPSKGGTQMTFFGTGFTDTGFQSVVFNLGTYSEHIQLNYDAKTSTFFCQVPNFQSQKKNLKFPVQCEVSLTLDGQQYYHYEKKLLIYSQKLAMEHIEPKSASALGDTEARIYMPLHPLIQQYCQNITVGFKSNSKADVENKIQDWVCVQGVYEEQNIVCKLPNLPFFDNNDPFYVVDVSFNGQQFTNHPQTMRFYLITDPNIVPNECQDQQEPQITITAQGLFDTPFKKLTLHLQFTSQDNNYICEKTVEATWHKTQKKFTFKMPTLQWIIGDVNITQKLLQDARSAPLIIKLNLSKHDPIEIGRFKFVIPPPPPQPEQDKKDAKKDGKKAGKK